MDRLTEGWAHSTVRSYEGALARVPGLRVRPAVRLGIGECEQRVGARPVQVCHEGNTAVHAAEYEGRPERRPLTRAELQAFLDAADDHVEPAAYRGEGMGPALRDATLFKVIYGRGLRRREAVMLDMADFARTGRAGARRLGTCHVRYGKAVRGSPPRRRAVATVMPWTAQALAQYIDGLGPVLKAGPHPALWLTERGGRISLRQVDDRFAAWRGGGGPARRAVGALPAAFVHFAPDRGRGRPAVRAAAGGDIRGPRRWPSTLPWDRTRETGCCGPRWTRVKGKGTAVRGRPSLYQWHLRRLMAEAGDVRHDRHGAAAGRPGITLSREQVYRLVTGVPERLSLPVLAALRDILDCGPGDLIEPVRKPAQARQACRGILGSSGPGRCGHGSSPGPAHGDGPLPGTPRAARRHPAGPRHARKCRRDTPIQARHRRRTGRCPRARPTPPRSPRWPPPRQPGGRLVPALAADPDMLRHGRTAAGREVWAAEPIALCSVLALLPPALRRWGRDKEAAVPDGGAGWTCKGVHRPGVRTAACAHCGEVKADRRA